MISDIHLGTSVRLAPEGTRIDYRDLGVTSHRTKLVSGDGQITLPAAADRPLVADGHLDVDLQALSRQPLVARALQAALDAPVRLEADYRLARDDAAVDIDRLSADLFYSTPGTAAFAARGFETAGAHPAGWTAVGARPRHRQGHARTGEAHAGTVCKRPQGERPRA